MNSLKTNGLIIENFPQEQYESIYLMVSGKYGNSKEYEHFSGAWNAVSYRYKSTVDEANLFIKLLKQDGSTPPPEERHLQEKTLFYHFSSCFSVFESVFYALYSIGSIINTSFFSMKSEKDLQKISIASTQTAFENAFPSDPIVLAFQKLIGDNEFKKLRTVRNILTHRTAPGRKMYVGLGYEDVPSVEWKLTNTPFNESIVESTEVELKRLLTELLTAVEIFCKVKL